MKRKELYKGIVTDRIHFPARAEVEVIEAENPEDNGQKVLIKNVIPGQKIEFRLKKQTAGNLVNILEESEYETEKRCPVFGECGGCVYLPMDYEAQLEMKRKEIVRIMGTALDGIHNGAYMGEGEAPYVSDDSEYYKVSDAIFDEIVPSPSVHEYRNKMEYSFGDEVKDGEIVIGMHRRNSKYAISPADDCLIVHEDFNKIVRKTRQMVNESGLDFYHNMAREGVLRHLLLRRSAFNGEIMIVIVTTTQDMERTAEFTNKYKDALLELENELEGKIAGIMHIENDAIADAVKCDKLNLLYGKDFITENLLGLEFKITPFSFFQTNSKGAERLYSVVRDMVFTDKMIKNGEKPVIYDLYSGTGTIAQIVAPVAKEVVGIEIVEEAVEAAKINAQLNNLDNCGFLAGDVLTSLDDVEVKPDIIILDPPRDGVNAKALKKILSYEVENIVYISCKPTSLARDLTLLYGEGYRLVQGKVVDMFPGTGHVETVVLLSQQKPDDTIEIDLDLDELDATSAELKATYQEIKDYVLKEFDLKVSNLYISQVKRKCGIEVGENYNLPKSENARVPQCPKEKEEAIKAALKYFAMI